MANTYTIKEVFNCSNLNDFHTVIPTSKNKLTYLHINIRSMIKNFPKLLQCIHTSNPPDIIIITEANISDTLCPLFLIDNYVMHTKLRSRRKGGGIIIYAHKTLNYEQIKTATMHSECFLGKITTPNKSEVILCSFYRPPDKNKHKFIDELSTILSKYETFHNFILIGDINIDLKCENIITERYRNLLAEKGLMCGISDYTRIEETNGKISKTCIDHIFVRNSTEDLYSAALGTVLADHRMIVLAANVVSSIRVVPKTQTKINTSILNSEISKVDWDQICMSECPNHIYNEIKSCYNNAYDKASYIQPIKTSRQNNCKWLTKKISLECEKRDELFIKYKKDPTNKLLKLEYNEQRNKTNKIIEKSRNNYYKKQIADNKSEPRKLWQIINNITGRIMRSVDEVITKAFRVDKNNEIAVANTFATEFIKNVTDIVPSCNIPLLNKSEYTSKVDKSMFYKKATNNKIKKIISHVSVHKSSGHDRIRPIDIKTAGEKIIPAITKLINTSVITGLYPNGLKQGIVRPIYKKGKEDVYSNYRPITILPILDKIFEKYVVGMLHHYYESNNILTETQYGFRQKKSTTQLLSKFTNEINGYLDKKQHVLLVFIDYSKAFDTLQHDQLIQKLDNTGIRGPILNWCSDYLRKRSYKVRVGESHSDEVDVTIGTAQGSVLGPLHYLIYVNDVINVVKHCSLYQFADDTCLIATDTNLTRAAQSLQIDFTSLCKWSHDAGLVLNSQKTKMMHIRSSHNRSDTTTVKLIAHCHSCLHSRSNCTDCITIDQVSQATYLGIIIDERFNWGPHVDKVCNKLRALLSKLNIVKNRIPYNILRDIYTALAESTITYGLTSYGRTFKTNLDKIHSLQQRILKTIVHKNIKMACNRNYDSLFLHCKVLPIQKMFKVGLLVEQYNRSDILRPVEHKIGTRKVTNKEMTTTGFNNTYGRRTDKYIMPRLINELPLSLKETITITNIKHKIKNYYLLN